MIENTLSLEICRPVEEHARQVMNWRNDPHTLAMSYHHDPKEWASFWPEFRDGYFSDAGLPPMFVRDGQGARVAFLRYQPAAHPEGGAGRIVAVSINVAPSARGRGIGQGALKLGSAFLRAVAGMDSVVAEIRVGNEGSRRAFAGAGYRLLGEADKIVADTGERCRIVRYIDDMAPLGLRTGLFCDLDGTLADSLAVMRQVYDRFLRRYGHVGSDADFARLNGPPLAVIVADLARTYGIDVPVEALVEIYLALVEEAYQEVAPHAGAADLLHLARRNGWAIGVVTSSTTRLAKAWLRSSGLAERVDLVIGGDSVSAGKPDPQPYLMALRDAGCDGAASLAVEDSVQGARSAVAAGIPTILVAPHQVVPPPGTLVQVGGLADVVALLKHRAA